jgi:small subunit ribosomal protein S17
MRERGKRKNLVGIVVGDSMDKTAMVQVSRIKKHRTYKKYIKSQSKYMAHDPQNTCRVGDRVRITETRPLSKMKRWRIAEILEKSIMGQEEASAPMEKAK